ncbi:MAG: lysophospholipid acyltransferase family protein [Planctomycetota bacterium]
MIYRFCRAVLRLLSRIYFRHTAVGAEQLPSRGGYLLAVNHASFLDPVLVGIAVKAPISFLARSTLFRPAPWGWFLRAVHAVPFDREGVGMAGFRCVIERLKAGSPVLVFPEGTRTRDGHIGRTRPGVLKLAQLANVPVVPTLLVGSFGALGRGALVPRPVRTQVRFGAAFAVEPGQDLEVALSAIERAWQELGATASEK